MTIDTLFTRDEYGNLRLYDFEYKDTLSPTVGDLAKAAVARGVLGTFDTALPIEWCNDVRAKTGRSPMGFVWSYPDKSIWGEPFPLTYEAQGLLCLYREALRADR